MDIIEQFKLIRFMTGMMAGTMSDDALREKVIQEVTSKNTKYEDLSPSDKKQCDEAVEGLKQLSGIFDDIATSKATLTKKFFDALQKQGFTAEQALAITAAQPIEAKAG